MGGAIAGMHYTGMAAARFAPGERCRLDGNYISGNRELGQAILEFVVLLIASSL